MRSVSIFVMVLCVLGVEYDLKRGWNLIALPCGEGDIAEYLPHIPPAFTFDAETGGYEELEGWPSPLDGIWLLCDDDTTVSIPCSTGTGVEDPLGAYAVGAFGIDSVMSAIELSDGGYLIATGVPDTSGPQPFPKLTLIKIDRGVEWARVYDFSRAVAIHQTDGGDILLLAQMEYLMTEYVLLRLNSSGIPFSASRLDMVFSENRGGFAAGEGIFLFIDTWLLYLDAEGRIIWSQDIMAPIYSIDVNTEGNAVILCKPLIEDIPFTAIFEIDESGDLLSGITVEGDANEELDRVVSLSSGAYLLSGMSMDVFPPLPEVICLSSEMEYLWGRKLDLPGAKIRYSGETSDGSPIMAGEIFNPDSTSIGMHLTFDMDGEILGLYRHFDSGFWPLDREYAVFAADLIFGYKSYWGTQGYLYVISGDCALSGADLTMEELGTTLSSISYSPIEREIETSDTLSTHRDLELPVIEYCP